MVYDGVHNTASWRCYPDANGNCCADTYACPCGYSRSNAYYHTYATSRVDSYTYTYTNANSDARANSNSGVPSLS
jgi:hypothetical protein